MNKIPVQTIALFLVAAAISIDLRAAGLTTFDLVAEFDVPNASLKVIHPAKNGNEDFDSTGAMESQNQISCARKQLAEYQRAVSAIQGGKSAVTAAFKKNEVQARILLYDNGSTKRGDMSEWTHVALDLNGAPAASTADPFSLSIEASLSSDSRGFITCYTVTADKITQALIKDRRMNLKEVASSSTRISSAPAIK